MLKLLDKRNADDSEQYKSPLLTSGNSGINQSNVLPLHKAKTAQKQVNPLLTAIQSRSILL